MRKSLSTALVSLLLMAGFSVPANAANTRTCAQGGTCVVGDIGPGGGVVFYARTSGDFSVSHSITYDDEVWERTETATVSVLSAAISALTFDYLEAAPATGITRLSQASADGATGTQGDFGAGQANTNLFLAQFPSDSVANNASYYADRYASNGKSDWFLPSVDELAVLGIRHLKNELGLNDPFQAGDIQIWSSTDGFNFLSRSDGLFKNFGGNSTQFHTVIPIRAFSSTPTPEPSAPAPEPSATPEPKVKPKSASVKIEFDRSSAVLTKVSKSKLKALVKLVGSGAKITVVASVGPLNNATKAQRNALAKLRAEATFKYLKSISKVSHSFKIKLIESGAKPVTTVTAN
jgi:hypothetical protein